METAGCQSAAMRTSPQTAAPPGERTALDEIHSMTRLTGETSPQRGIEYANRFLYSGALVQTTRDVNERFGLSTAGLESAIGGNKDASDGNSNSCHANTVNDDVAPNHRLDSVGDNNTQKTPKAPSGSVSQQLIDHLLQSDDDESPTTTPQGNDATDVLMSPQEALSSLPVGGMFAEPPPMFFPDVGGGIAPSSLEFPGRGVGPSSLDFPGRGVGPSSLDFPGRGVGPSSLEFPVAGVTPSSLEFPGAGVTPSSLEYPGRGVAPSSLEFPLTDMMLSPRPVEAGVSLCCTLCNYTGRSQRSLQKHYKAHSMSYKICRYCRKAFERPSDLLRHEERHEMALARNHTPMIMRGGNFSTRRPGAAGSRAKPKHARVLHCRRCGFATTEHHILALHNKKQHQQQQQQANWFCCDVCGQKFISKTSLELHCVLAHPAAAVRIDSYSHNVLTDTKVLSCSVSVDNVVQLHDVSAGWFESLREQEVPTVSSAADLRHIARQSNVPEPAGVNRSDFVSIDRPMDLSVYGMSPEGAVVAPRNDMFEPVQKAGDVFNFDDESVAQDAAIETGNPILPLPHSVASSPVVPDASRDAFAFPGSPDSDVAPLSSSVDSRSDTVGSPNVTTKRESRHVRVGQYTCDQCSYSSNILRKMDQHKQAHDGRYICKLCYKAFIKTSDLTRHWFTHGITLEGQLKCDTCDYHTNNRDLLELHMKVHYHQRGSYRMRKSSKHRACTICHEWVYKRAMQKHLLQVHNWPPSTGETPKPKTDSPKKHLLNHSPKKNLANHSPQTPPAGRSAKKKSPSSVLAPKSPGGASPKAQLAGSTSKLNGYACPECDDNFTSSRAIIQHLLVAHPSETPAKHGGKKQTASASNAVCELCDREFADTIRLARHKAWHTRVSHPARKQCPICEKLFKTVMHLNQHMRGHSSRGQKPFECDRCGVTFGLYQTLLKHQQRKCGSPREEGNDAARSESHQDTIDGIERNDYAHTNGTEAVCDDGVDS